MSESTLRIWGRRPVLESLRARIAVAVFLEVDRRPSPVLAEIERNARESAIPVHQLTRERMQSMAPDIHTQGVVAEVRRPVSPDLTDFLESLVARTSPPFLLILDEVQDPHNLGALLRTAEAAGVDGIIVPERRTAPLSGTVAKVSAGAVGFLTIVTVTNLSQALQQVKLAGIWALGLDESAAQSIYEVDLRAPTALVLGSEGQGLRRLTLERCDLTAKLPMAGRIGSLNASVAGGIAMFEVVRQRVQ